jgi:hypothetical protein
MGQFSDAWPSTAIKQTSKEIIGFIVMRPSISRLLPGRPMKPLASRRAKVDCETGAR